MSDKLLFAKTTLGKKTNYINEYDNSLLTPIPRSFARDEIHLSNDNLPFYGNDLWNAYEISFLNNKGKPEVAIGEIIIPYDSEHLIESKSFKLYLNSFNNTRFDNLAKVKATMQKDLSYACGKEVSVNLYALNECKVTIENNISGTCLDDLDISVDNFSLNSELLKPEKEFVKENLYTNLFKANCRATGQPDWATVFINYEGIKINHESLLKYLISFRDHREFHEPCVERIFVDLMLTCKPEKLSVYARFTRRGGLDINPFRSNFEEAPDNIRLLRQ